jgi:hypothetical protein
VTLSQAGTALSISAAGSAVTVTTDTGCTIHTSTPTTVDLSGHNCR